MEDPQKWIREHIQRKRIEEYGEDPDETLNAELEKEGWVRTSVTPESTHMDKLNPDSVRFEPTEFRATNDIENEYLQRYKGEGLVEVKLVPSHSLKEKIGYQQDQHSYHVYMRKSNAR